MNIGKQVSWVMVRTIGLTLVIYSIFPLVTAITSGSVAYALREHSVLIVESPSPVPEHQQNTPENRQLHKAYTQAKVATSLYSIIFLVSLSAGLYCLKGGKAIQKLLMPPEENNNT